MFIGVVSSVDVAVVVGVANVAMVAVADCVDVVVVGVFASGRVDVYGVVGMVAVAVVVTDTAGVCIGMLYVTVILYGIVCYWYIGYFVYHS